MKKEKLQQFFGTHAMMMTFFRLLLEDRWDFLLVGHYNLENHKGCVIKSKRWGKIIAKTVEFIPAVEMIANIFVKLLKIH